MTILVADDDRQKCDHIAQHVRAVCAELHILADVVTKESYRETLKFCTDLRPRLLILDMTMPTFVPGIEEPGGRPRHFAGRDILRELKRRHISIPTVVCTGYEVIGEGSEQRSPAELTAQLSEAFPGVFMGTVLYTTSDNTWRSELTTIITDVAKGANGHNITC